MAVAPSVFVRFPVGAGSPRPRVDSVRYCLSIRVKRLVDNYPDVLQVKS